MMHSKWSGLGRNSLIAAALFAVAPIGLAQSAVAPAATQTLQKLGYVDEGTTDEHAYLGVRIQSVTGGARITQVVDGSPAAKAGLKVGDVITAFDGKTTSSADDLTAAVTRAKSGDTVTVTVTRGGTTKHVSVHLGVQPSSASS